MYMYGSIDTLSVTFREIFFFRFYFNIQSHIRFLKCVRMKHPQKKNQKMHLVSE